VRLLAVHGLESAGKDADAVFSGSIRRLAKLRASCGTRPRNPISNSRRFPLVGQREAYANPFTAHLVRLGRRY
jgi:hypothetical protein